MTRDVAIFGSGFAAYELARVLAGMSKSVTVIERGSRDVSPAGAELSRVPFRRERIQSGGIDFGANVPAAFDRVPRYVGLGGTSALWSGKWRPLDEIDFKRRGNGRRWPLSVRDLELGYKAARESYGVPEWPGRDLALAPYERLVTSHDLRLLMIFEQSPPLRLQDRWAALEAEGWVEIVCDAVAEAVPSHGDRLVGVRVRDGGRDFVIAARQFVVACGGIESVHVAHRLRARLKPPADSGDACYGGFMDHPKAVIGELVIRSNRELTAFMRRSRSESGLLLGLSLPEDELAQIGIGNHTIFLRPSPERDGAERWRVVINIEQFPETENAVIAGPSPSVRWRVSGSTWRNLEAFLGRFVPRLTRMLGPVALHRRLELSGASHHLGAMPMGEPGQGMIGPDCRFEDLDNLYCVSSALFPFGGSANPTMTVVALAHRLARQIGGAPHVAQ